MALETIPAVNLEEAPAYFSSFTEKGLTLYIRTTDTCQLDCEHCFTSGSKGQKVFFDVAKTINFIKGLKSSYPNIPYVKILLHGGEPLLCDPKDIIDLWKECKDLWERQEWSIQTNLTLKLNEKHEFILKEICEGSFGTSWDKDIRWTTSAQKELWRRNVKRLTNEGSEITVMVSINASVAQTRPIEILREMRDLGVDHVLFEKITEHGNAGRLNRNLPDSSRERARIAPSNEEVNRFFFWMFEDAVKYRYHEWINNITLSDLFSGFKVGDGISTHCRDCEQSILTITASGRVSGCPNTANDYTFGKIEDEIDQSLASPVRVSRIVDEIDNDPRCYSCDFFSVCKGGCHQLEWEGDECPSPKNLFREIELIRHSPIFDEIIEGPR